MRMHVPLATLGTLLDLPAGVSVIGVDGTEGVTMLYLEGVQLDVEGDQVTAEYSVDTKGHRRFVCFKAPEPEPVAVETPEAPAPVTETVGEPAPADRPKPAARPGKAGS